jgi:sugar phosphate isomerase/epimerase
MSRIPVALQLWSVRQDCAEDLASTLKAVAEMGYEGVEFAGYHGHDAGELRGILDDLGLAVAGSHLGVGNFLEDRLEGTLEFEEALGNEYLVVPALGSEYRESKEAWLKTAGMFNDISTQVRARGMTFGYHNHRMEFEAIGDEMPMDIFLSNTSPEIIMQLDVGHVCRAGQDPREYLKRYPGRAVTVHLKEYAPDNDKAILGDGQVPWDDVFHLCETVGGTRWYIVEQETYAYPPLECAARCLDALRDMGKL